MKTAAIKSMPNINGQRGWTFWSLLFTLAVILFFVYIGMRLVPVYSDNQNIKQAMELSLREVQASNVSRGGIASKIGKQMQLDGISGFLNLREDLKVKRKGNKIILSLQYDREIPLFLNMSLLVKFDNLVEKQ